ncbi:MAG: carboxypeptidase regulatory-like domain-containing protein, partial [Proteobacteria bacterium]
MHRFFTALAIAAMVPNFAHAGLADEYGFQATAVSGKTAPQDFWGQLQSLFVPGNPGAQAVDLTVTITDEKGAPLAGASVLVGSGRGVPFAGNETLSDAAGRAGFADASLRGAALPSITVSKEGYSTFTMVAPAGNEVAITLPRYTNDADFAFLEGDVSGFATGVPSNALELGIFIPAFRPESLLNFDPQQFVSSYTTKINVFGERDVPGNVVLPTQRKKYGFLPISLSKPNFIMPLSLGLKAHMTALAGSVPISGAIGAIQANDFLGAINLASFTHVSWTTNQVEVRGPEKFNIVLNQEIAPKAITAKLSGIPLDLDVVAVSVTDPSRDRSDFVPLDVKAVKSESVSGGSTDISLGTLKNRRADDALYVFTGIFDQTEVTNKDATRRWIVGSLQAVNGSAATFAGFLNPVKSGTVTSANRSYAFASPATPALAPDLVLLNI